MKRTTTFALLLVLSACNDHPIKIVEYKHFYGDGLDESGSSDSSNGTSGDGDGDGDQGGESGSSDTDTDSGTDDAGGFCGDGVVDPDEECDDGEDNGPIPAWCSEDCVFQGPQ